MANDVDRFPTPNMYLQNFRWTCSCFKLLEPIEKHGDLIQISKGLNLLFLAQVGESIKLILNMIISQLKREGPWIPT
jgi:hypothetical protein